MSGVYQIPPARDLPSGRLTERCEHLLAEIVRDRESSGAPAPMRLPWPRRRKVVVLVAVTFLLVATACAFGVRALILDEGFVGVPPDGATPSTPEWGELVLSYWGHPGGGRELRAFLYADGRLIWDRSKTGFLEQRLTPEGVELLLSEFISTGLFDRDVRLVRSGVSYPDWAVIEVRNGDRLVKVDWGGAFNPPLPTQEPTPEQESAIERLGAQLVDPGSWLPASAWENREIRAYVGSRYEVCLVVQPSSPWGTYGNAQPLELSEILTMIPAAAADVLREAEFTVTGQTLFDGRTPRNDYCSDITTEKAQAIAKALDAEGLPRVYPDNVQWYRFHPPSFGNDGRALEIRFLTYLPDGFLPCGDCG
jgi:hypothetical protein